MASEFDLIARYFKRPAPAGMLGVGDDCALFGVPPGMQVATSTDLLIEGRHFFPDVDPRALGHKALAVNVSDLAAMGARPIGCLLGLALPTVAPDWLQAFSTGFHALAAESGCPLIGGDTTGSTLGVAISVTVFGAVAADRALRRDGARPGDLVWVSGALGAADIAYRLLSGQMPADAGLLAATRDALEWPRPRYALGQALAGVASAAIDISDGLLQDLGHVLDASGVGAQLRFADLPVAPGLDGVDPARLRHALLGGGDVYELCFTAAPERADAVRDAAARAGVAVTAIGCITSAAGLVVLGRDGQPEADLPRGFDHFSTP
ncbi:thiamine-phosphate kinase [Achromobacter aloeverae]|uniref:Thiamine-monophosphate kinase n=1 Tax=Achromobacter aloeverae TaxID=1750518 RepID=A0A4Q1HLN6_9BURK|nr:thiamine-phosphate kinase [Achromobacter aloeverae]RXN90565.1 thiamine-phosphate kinase [Achromobacter aloeverae]